MTIDPENERTLSELFRALSGAQPYRWQERLLSEWFGRGRLPEAVDIPTGLGKTKVIAAWLCARMTGALLPRRLVYVVDRRAVVDQATVEAQGVAEKLDALLLDESMDAQTRDAYSARLGLQNGGRIPISTLRGQFVDNRRWMDRPFGAAIVVGTVDMVGSRLLFSGYGVSPGMRPAHAGLLGSDTLVVLDEAHLVPAFESLLDQIAAMHSADRQRTGTTIPPFSILTLSATGRKRSTAATFSLTDADISDPPVAARLSAIKRLRLQAQVSTTELSSALAEQAWVRGQGGRRVIVFSNSRNVAQEVETALRERAKREHGKDAAITGLLVGERRLYERTLEYDPPEKSERTSVVDRFSPGSPLGAKPAFLVATSAGEVGVDLDADDLVCDLVPWERMVQRFGRVNRRSGPGISYIDVIPSLSEKDAENPVTAERFDQLLAPFVASEWKEAEDGTRDASPGELRRVKELIPDKVESASTPAPFSPKLDRATVLSWSMTSLRDHSGRPSIEPYLRGWTDDPPQASIVWRRLFPLRADFATSEFSLKADKRLTVNELNQFFAAAPPHGTEILEAPAHRIVDIVKKRLDAYSASATAQRTNLEAEVSPEPRHEPAVIVLDSRNEVEDYFAISQIRDNARTAARFARLVANRTVVIDARLGGLSDTGLLDAKTGAVPPTLDGPSWLPLAHYGQRRLQWGPMPASPSEAGWKFEGYRWTADPDREGSDVLWVEVFRESTGSAGDPAISRKQQALGKHHEWTREEALRVASGLQLPEAKATLLELAAVAHDSGKARELWQNAMNAAKDGRPFAKTTGGAIPRALAGYRHEFGSLGDILDGAAFATLDETDRELALHLVAAHHGYSRPVINAFDPERPPSRSIEVARSVAIRYARLERFWGPWGLAWWEAVLRSADWAASARANK